MSPTRKCFKLKSLLLTRLGLNTCAKNATVSTVLIEHCPIKWSECFDGYLFELVLVILIGDHKSQSQVPFHTSSSFTQQRMLCFTDCGLHTCRRAKWSWAIEQNSETAAVTWIGDLEKIIYPVQQQQPQNPALHHQASHCYGCGLVDGNLLGTQLHKPHAKKVQRMLIFKDSIQDVGFKNNCSTCSVTLSRYFIAAYNSFVVV